MLKKSWRNAAIGILAALAVVVAGRIALADNPKCQANEGGCSASVNSSGQLVEVYNLTGLGGTTKANWSLTATVSGDARCQSKSGNCPEAANKFGPTDQSTSGSFTVHNGNASGSATLTPASGLACPKGQQPLILDVTYSAITFTVDGTVVDSPAGSLSSGTLATCP